MPHSRPFIAGIPSQNRIFFPCSSLSKKKEEKKGSLTRRICNAKLTALNYAQQTSFLLKYVQFKVQHDSIKARSSILQCTVVKLSCSSDKLTCMDSILLDFFDQLTPMSPLWGRKLPNRKGQSYFWEASHKYGSLRCGWLDLQDNLVFP